ncbi:hypothetical protein Pan110_00400 [Gimesia panareensis]|nr:hypothetical protein Pan110_00400 [Gimesia panareensis]
MKKMVSMLHSLLIGPVTFCVGLMVILSVSLIWLNRMVEVDTSGRPLVHRKCVKNRHPITTEMIELTRELGWDENPDNLSKLEELAEFHRRMTTEVSSNDESLSLIKNIEVD